MKQVYLKKLALVVVTGLLFLTSQFASAKIFADGNPPPNTDFSTYNNLCINSGINFNANYQPNPNSSFTNYHWYFGDGTHDTIIQNYFSPDDFGALVEDAVKSNHLIMQHLLLYKERLHRQQWSDKWICGQE